MLGSLLFQLLHQNPPALERGDQLSGMSANELSWLHYLAGSAPPRQRIKERNGVLRALQPRLGRRLVLFCHQSEAECSSYILFLETTVSRYLLAFLLSVFLKKQDSDCCSSDLMVVIYRRESWFCHFFPLSKFELVEG